MHSNPLALEGWLQYNRAKWGLQPRLVGFPADGSEGPVIEAVLYLDAKGRVRLPKTNPYLPVAFAATSATAPRRVSRQRLDAAESLAAEMRRLGLGNTIILPPEISDVRPWQ